ncbi:MAG: hypothetical protein AAFR05_04845 [Bacteroidota bacterium]
MFTKSKLILLGLLLCVACSHSDHQNEVVISCIHCKGCVERQLHFIAQHALDEQLEIRLDTTCIRSQKIPPGLRYTHHRHSALFEEYGPFGNLLYYDAKGKRIELLTDQNLADYITVEE